jgi:integrase
MVARGQPMTAAQPGSTPGPRARRTLMIRAAGRSTRSEAAGLRWHDIDLENKVMYVTWQVQHDDQAGALVICPLKTAASRRAVALDATTVAVLRPHLAAQPRTCHALRPVGSRKAGCAGAVA